MQPIQVGAEAPHVRLVGGDVFRGFRQLGMLRFERLVLGGQRREFTVEIVFVVSDHVLMIAYERDRARHPAGERLDGGVQGAQGFHAHLFRAVQRPEQPLRAR